jgi:hypothetical protein
MFDPEAIERLTPRVREEVQLFLLRAHFARQRRAQHGKEHAHVGWPRTARWWLNDPETKLARELRQRDG